MKDTITYCCYYRLQGQQQTLKKNKPAKLHHGEKNEYNIRRLRIPTVSPKLAYPNSILANQHRHLNSILIHGHRILSLHIKTTVMQEPPLTDT